MRKEEMVCVNCLACSDDKMACHENPIPVSFEKAGLKPEEHRCSQGEWTEWDPDAYDRETGGLGMWVTKFWGDWDKTDPKKDGILFREFFLD